MKWTFWLVDVPARIVDGWWLAYRYILMIATMIAVTAVVLMLVLAAFGVRWGW